MNIITDKIADRFTYDPLTGDLTWKEFGLGKKKNIIAGTLCKDGYIAVKVKGVQYKIHRIIMYIINKNYDQSLTIEHKDRCRTNNRKYNLTTATSKEQCENRSVGKIRSSNTSGIIGVSFNKKAGKWVSYIGVKGKRIPLGTYENWFEAVCARKSAEVTYNIIL